MSKVVKKLPPIARVAAATGLAAGAAGVWAWRSRRAKVDEADASTEPTPEWHRHRTGPMVAVYLDQASVEKLNLEYPGTKPSRLRKVVIQYNPSDEQRGLYEAYFGRLATVKLTGEASSDGRIALAASVSSGGNPVQPQSLSCAVDVTPGDVGGGPLASTVLVEQIKRTGALAKESWKGTLPALSAHERDFPSEDGSYNKLDEPIILTGSICRADWIQGVTGICRTKTAGGGKRKDGWAPQGCPMCNMLESSPCRDVYKRFDEVSRRQHDLQRPAESSSEDSKSLGNPPESSSGGKDERGVADARGSGNGEEGEEQQGESKTKTTVGSDGGTVQAGVGVVSKGSSEAGTTVAGGDEKALPRGNQKPSREGEGERGGRSVGEGGLVKESGDGSGGEPETEEEKRRREEVERLESEKNTLAMEMFSCSHFHHVFEDSQADDGVVPDMSRDDEDEDDDGDRDARGIAGASESGGAEEDVEVKGQRGNQIRAEEDVEVREGETR